MIMFIRIKYNEFGTEKGFTTWVTTKEELLQRLKDLKINLKWVHKLEICQKGSDKWKEYDPRILKG